MEDQLTCCICGAPTPELPENELLDGYLCPDCARKLSPWFQDLSLAEFPEIQEQLRLREENRYRLQNFHPTWRFGDGPMVLVDQNAHTFAVTDTPDLSDNPDLIQLASVLGCKVKVEKDKEHLGGKRTRYAYTFHLHIDLIEHPYLDTMDVPLHHQPLVYESEERGFLGLGGFDPDEQPDYQAMDQLAHTVQEVLEADPEDFDVEIESRYRVNPEDFAPAAAPTAAPSTVHCSWCGSDVTPKEDQTCPLCGGPL